MNKETRTLIEGMLGVLAEAEDAKIEGILMRSFLRIRVGINITRALPTGFWLEREELPPLWVFFKYERLPDIYCFNYGIIGNEKKNYRNSAAMACWDPTKKKYSPGLGVSQVHPLSSMGVGASNQYEWIEVREEQVHE
ncbi:hypothetical protein Ahy_A06g026081 [Arachis hypogaea]|uniref:Zinc knuckle CX2CX4HX4C domain-containing protein n=1 Tax=Arachis hypogaea TaxID=3818 RepID=A0A445CJB5_ARAHY|nr:hypothetical protein Ahy_A06g026081 [Arachis hypogaea]